MRAYLLGRHTDIDSINKVNNLIKDCKKKAKAIFEKAEQKEYIPSKEEVRAAFKVPNKTTHPIYRAIDEFINIQTIERGWSTFTINTFYRLYRELTYTGLKTLEDINDAGMGKYLGHLRRENLDKR